ncbi:PaaI family thioesterase [Neomoorella thermoacetica]|uniref:PaaI family thioesterase n=1 Tax=Neomoorella thermoacetica TaxID=1525 RepID=UPI00092468FF|nr:PaaI family thioesterase [Moorella thermoacetica]OIQ11816.1 acyl-coenzyme A thioesterase PaaI [Moorella thermoacetica]
MKGDFYRPAGDMELQKCLSLVLPENPLANLLGLKVVEIGPGRSVVQLKVLPKHLNPWKTLHGGVYAAMADLAMGTAVRTTGKQAVTLNLQVGYLRPVQPGQVVVCQGMVIHDGDQIVVTEAKMVVDERPVATAGGIFYVKQETGTSVTGAFRGGEFKVSIE